MSVDHKPSVEGLSHLAGTSVLPLFLYMLRDGNVLAEIEVAVREIGDSVRERAKVLEERDRRYCTRDGSRNRSYCKRDGRYCKRDRQIL